MTDHSGQGHKLPPTKPLKSGGVYPKGSSERSDTGTMQRGTPEHTAELEKLAKKKAPAPKKETDK